MRFAHLNIVSTNWQELVDFYVKTFHCIIVPPIRNQSGSWLDKGTGLKKAQLEGAHLRLPGHGEHGPTLEIYQYTSIDDRGGTAPNSKGFGHIAFEVKSVQKTLEKLIQNGGAAFGEITQKEVVGVGEITFIYAKDPEGNFIELQSWKYF